MPPYLENSCVVFYGEPTVNLQGKGSGGRKKRFFQKKMIRHITGPTGTNRDVGSLWQSLIHLSLIKHCNVTRWNISSK